jgi:hypothetical protein
LSTRHATLGTFAKRPLIRGARAQNGTVTGTFSGTMFSHSSNKIVPKKT